jgi:hypothetical protein
MALTKVSRGLLTTSIVDNGNATAITIDSSENVGIGVSPEAWNTYTPLQVQLASLSGYTNGDSRLSNNAYYAGGWKYINSIPATQYLMDAANGVHTWSTAASGTADAAITWQERMRITSAGKLVVNGTVPGYVGTDITVGSPTESAAGLSILTSTTGTGYVLFGDVTGDASGGYSGQVNYNHGTNRMGFNTNNVERLAITDVGAIFATGVRSSSAANNDLRYNTSNGEIYYQTSSQRYKSNIVDLEFDTSNLYNLRPVSFDDNETGERCFGLIAEDTFDQIPEAVVTRNIDGETVPDSIPYSMLSVLIINEMKNLKTENDSLRSRIEALENN